ncbi:DegV family protein [Clostridium oryzae]|uniref:Fatty acid-binding protein n=1 Tax=Clostridium oryzae TaxID=1450648 RepID=A0A1V4I451_9CLOT|nr:DegV family protein [Clostridium oryzae]OPJ54679.1 fatty acid-binding protein [Clostridium oryzae]
MDKIKIITDSTCDIPPELVKKYDIEVIPLYITFGDESYLDGEEIKLDELIARIEKGDKFPGTAQIVPQRFYDIYKKYLNQGYKIISIHISSKMSGTYHSSCLAKEMLETEHIYNIDSFNVTAGLGLLVLKACRLKQQGMTIENIYNEILKAIPHVKSALAFETLDFLVKGGRLSKTAGTIGNILGIKLILEVKDGEMSVKDKVRGSKKAVRNILEYVNNTGIKANEPISLLHVRNKDILATLRENIVEENMDYIECEVGCTVGVHAGPGACGIFFIENY